MPTINDYLNYGEAALGSYGQNLSPYADNKGKLVSAGMPDAEATKFQVIWDVILQKHDKLNLAEVKGFAPYFENHLQSQSGFRNEERELINLCRPNMRGWCIEVGAGAMVTIDTLNRGAFMLGGSGAAKPTRGTSADLLVASAIAQGNMATSIKAHDGGAQRVNAPDTEKVAQKICAIEGVAVRAYSTVAGVQCESNAQAANSTNWRAVA